MPFRERMRRAFGTGHSSPSSTLVPTPATTSPPPEPSTLTTETTIEHKEPKTTITSTPSPSSSTSNDLKPVETKASLKPVETKASLKPVETNSTLRSLKKIVSHKPKEDKRSRKQRKEDEKFKDWPADIYKPHEMPAPRYKRTPDPSHKAALEAYNWENAFSGVGLGGADGRRSRGSLYSPFGSRLPSRLGSIASRRSAKKSFALGGGESAGPSRSASVAEVLDEHENESESQNAAAPHPLSRAHTQPAGSTSTSSSDPTTHKIPDLITSSSIGSDSSLETPTPTVETSKTVTRGEITRAHTSSYLPHMAMQPGKPFSEEELARALSRTGIIED